MIDDWIDIRERLPAHRQKVLISAGDVVTAAEADTQTFMTEFGAAGVYWDACGFGGYEWEFDFRQEEVTHWRLLPAPAKPANKQEQQ